jgi:mRNA-degrading endonuclease RelE of RelBE toxin-antitoxin system
MDIKLENPCAIRKDFCVNCHSHFLAVRPRIMSVLITKRFFSDVRDEKEAKSIVKDILDCSNVNFSELHKFEGHINGNLIFRAKKGGIHIIYCVDKNMRIIFLRTFKNYKKYGKFLENKKEIRNTIMHL